MPGNTQLVDLINYNKEDIIFSDVIDKEIKPKDGKGPTIKFKKIMVSTKYEDGSVGDLVFCTPSKDHFCFGLQEFVNDNGKINRTMSFSLYDKNISTPRQEDAKNKATKWASALQEKLIDAGFKYLLSLIEKGPKKGGIIDKVGMGEISSISPSNLSPLKQKDDSAPIFAGKLMERIDKDKNDVKILTLFEDVNGNEVDPFSLRKTYCKIEAAIKFESIFINATILAFQFRLFQVIVEPVSSGPTRLLSKRSFCDEPIEVCEDSNPMMKLKITNDDEDEKIVDSDEDVKVTTVSRKKKPVKKTK